MPDEAEGDAPAKKRKTSCGHECERDPAALRIPADVEIVVEGEVFPMHSQVLALSSPVFAGLLRSQMAEQLSRRISFEGKSKDEFQSFAAFLQPVGGRKAVLDAGNVDYLLPWFDEYQVDSLKEDCHHLLLSLPCTYDRLVDSYKFGLDAQYKRCLQGVKPINFQSKMPVLVKYPNVLCDLLPALAKKDKAFEALVPLIDKCMDLPPAQLTTILRAFFGSVSESLVEISGNIADTSQEHLAMTLAVIAQISTVKDTAKAEALKYDLVSLADELYGALPASSMSHNGRVDDYVKCSIKLFTETKLPK